MMKKLVISLLLIGLLAGCSGQQVPKSIKAEDWTASLTPLNAGIGQAPGTGTFPAHLTAQMLSYALQAEEINPVLSPASLYFAMALAANGAEGQTLVQMEEAMGCDVDTLNAFCQRLMLDAKNMTGGTTLNISNSIWLVDSFIPREEYLNAAAGYYAAQVYTADLPASKTTSDINAWVNNKTEGLIPKLLANNLEEDTLAVIVNTLYLKAKWATPFSESATRKGTFYLEDHTTVTTAFMSQENHDILYFMEQGREGVVLPYKDGQLAFIALLPGEGESLPDMVTSLSTMDFTHYLTLASPGFVRLSMPKFEANLSIPLNGVLIQMGVTDALSESHADFSMLGEDALGRNLYLSQVLQQAKIIVDEEGTQAAAATAIMVMGAAAPTDTPLYVTFDRPFAYAVLDTQTGTVYFAGLMQNPAQ